MKFGELPRGSWFKTGNKLCRYLKFSTFDPERNVMAIPGGTLFTVANDLDVEPLAIKDVAAFLLDTESPEYAARRAAAEDYP
jgi:hypothetical protein